MNKYKKDPIDKFKNGKNFIKSVSVKKSFTEKQKRENKTIKKIVKLYLDNFIYEKKEDSSKLNRIIELEHENADVIININIKLKDNE